MYPFLTKRIEVPETWFDALMFAFKLPTVILPVWLLVWYVVLPPMQSQIDLDFYGSMIWSAADDFAEVASNLPSLFFLAAGVLVVGGLMQMFKYSRRSAGWSLGFGFFALIVGIVLAVGTSAPHGPNFVFKLTLLR